MVKQRHEIHQISKYLLSDILSQEPFRGYIPFNREIYEKGTPGVQEDSGSTLREKWKDIQDGREGKSKISVP